MEEKKRSKAFDKMMIDAIRGSISFFAWKINDGIVEKCELKIKACSENYNEIELDLLAGATNDLSQIISGSRTVNIYIPELSVSFCSVLKSVKENKRIVLYSPPQYSFYERRKNTRVQPSKTCYVSFEYNKQFIRNSIYDFSVGGIAVVLPKSSRSIIPKTNLQITLILDIGLKKMHVQAELINSFPIDRFKFENLPYGGFKFAFRFTEISKEDKAFLENAVLDEIFLQAQKKNAV